MQNCKSGSYLLLTVIAALSLIAAASIAAAQSNDRPWVNPSLSPEERADLVLKQLTLDEKVALLHGNGMAHAPQWQMPLSNLVRDTWKVLNASESRLWLSLTRVME